MNDNLPRDTPGRLLLFCTVLMLPLVVFAWRVHLGRGQFDWAEYPTALGDARLYSDAAMLGENDYLAPNLKCPGHEKGLFRRSVTPERFNDEAMWKVAEDSTGRHFVYAAAPVSEDGKTQASDARRYLKTGDNQFIEFGARKFYADDPNLPAPSKTAPAQ